MQIPEAEDAKIQAVRTWVSGRVRDIRLAKDMTQPDLGARMSIHPSRVGDLENNRNDYKASSIFRAACALGVNMDVFFRGCPGWKMKKNAPGEAVIVIKEDEALARMRALGYTAAEANKIVAELRRNDEF